MTDRSLYELAETYWQRDRDGLDLVWDILHGPTERIPALIAALAKAAPEGTLSYIGVDILESLSIPAPGDPDPGPVLDLLDAAELDTAVVFEILSGPYPDYLEQWRVREHYASTFTVAQLDALYDWPLHSGRRLTIDGEGVRLDPSSSWFDKGF